MKSSGNLAVCGLRKTAKIMESKYKRAAEMIYKDIYVDDCISGETGAECVRVTTGELKLVLNKGGLQAKR